MRAWKEVALTFILLGASFFLLLMKSTLPAGPSYPKALGLSSSLPPPPKVVHTHSSLSSSSSSSSSSAMKPAPHRPVRAAEDMNSILSEFSILFQSFTEGELQKMIATLVDRKERGMGTESGHRTKREKKDPNPCSLHEIMLTVREMGLGYDSDETVLFRYCSGKCTDGRGNYDFVMKHMRGRDNGKKDKPRYGPCCRPIKFEKKMSFLDNKNKFYTLQNVSARACGCV